MDLLIQEDLFLSSHDTIHVSSPFKSQLLKWIGNKQRFAHEIISYFPPRYNTYIEPFLGSGAILGTLAPQKAIAGDIYEPLIEIWLCLKNDPQLLYQWYKERHSIYKEKGNAGYEEIRNNFNSAPNGPDLLFLCRSCYGGVVRFRKKDGFMSTPCGAHTPISPASFRQRVDKWHTRTKNADFYCQSFEKTMDTAKEGDVIYCDPPYKFCQSILYGAQSFNLTNLFDKIAECKNRGVKILLSFDGSKKSGEEMCHISFPKGLFEQEVFVNCGQSMLRRFQLDGKVLEDEMVHDRLMLTY